MQRAGVPAQQTLYGLDDVRPAGAQPVSAPVRKARKPKQCGSVHAIETGQRYRCCLPDGHEGEHMNSRECVVATWAGQSESEGK